MKSRKPQLPIIDYTEPKFATHSLDALKKYGAFILENVPKISTDAAKLLNEFDDLSNQSENVIDVFRAGSDLYDFAGFHPYDQHWAGRRFSECYGLVGNSERKITQRLPTQNFRHAAVNFLGTAHEVTDKVLAVIGDGFNMGNEWKDYFHDYTMLGIADSYVPPTQEKIKGLQSRSKLVMSDNRLEAFDPHCDLNPLTFIAYSNNDCSGLEMELPNKFGNLSYEPIVLPEVDSDKLTPLVLLGSPIEILTGGQLRAPKHRVVLEPMQSGETFSRRLASAFTLFGSNSKGPQPPAPSKTYDSDTQNKYEHIENERKEKVRDLPINFLNRFPREEEIEKVKSSGEMTMYIRR